MRKIIITLTIILIAKFAYSVDLYWHVNPYSYEFNMNVTASVYIDAVEQQDAMLEVGVFFGEELRGSALARFSPLVNKYVYDLTIYSNDVCNLSFKLYNHNTNTVSDLICDQILTFEPNGILGNPINPYIVYFSSISDENNVFYIPDVIATPSKQSVLPVYLDNTSEIIKVQFTIDLPIGMYLESDNINIGIRAEDHIVDISQTNDYQYVCEMYSPTNQALKGYTGKLFDIAFNISNTLPDGSVHQMVLSDVVLNDITTNNVVTSFDIGDLFVVNGVDLVVPNVMALEEEIIPGETINVGWTVLNDGGQNTTAGWKEEISLVNDNSDNVFLGSIYYDGILSAGGQISRSATFNVPEVLGLDGNVKIQIKLIPYTDSGENASMSANNITVGDDVVNVRRKLFLELLQNRVEEDNNILQRCKLSRSGSWHEEETFELSKDDSDRIELVNSISIPSGQSASYFYIRVIDNETIDNDSIVNITANGDNYDEVVAQLIIEDNEYPNLNISASVAEIDEGETFNLNISTEQVSENPITIYITSDHSEHFDFPAQVVLPSGTESIVVDVTAVDDDIANVTLDAIFSVNAPRYNGNECYVSLLDNDIPEISLELTPHAISESAGYTAVSAILRRLTLNDNKVTVLLSDNSNGRLFYTTNTIVLNEGESEKQFTIGIIDNESVDDEQEFTITASIYISSCDCSASGTTAGVVEQTLKVLDDDGPALSLSLSKSMLFEGNEEAAILTVTRNTDNNDPLVVTLTSDADDVLNYDSEVVIPSGETSANVVVGVEENNTSSDNRTVIFTAEAENFTDGTCWATITDQTLPDIIVSSLIPASDQIIAGDVEEVSISVTNIGIATFPAPVKVSLYMNNKELLTYHIQEDILPDSSATFTRNVFFPDIVGNFYLHAAVNESHSTDELIYINNNSDFVPITMLPSFTATVSTDKSTYIQNDSVIINGQITGQDVANADVEVYIINGGLRQTVSVVTDDMGQFSTTWYPYYGQIGHYSIGACYPNENKSDELAGIDIYGLKRTSDSYITCDTYVNEPYNGTIELYNPGRLPLTAVNVEVVSAPEHCDVETQIQSVIDGGDMAVLSYTLTNDSVSSSNEYEKIKLRVTTAEQAYLDISLYHYCFSHKGQLVTNIEEINTTMIKGSSRDYMFTITNIGKGETGKIYLSLPDVDWMQTATPAEMSSLAYGESATVVLRLTPTEDMSLNSIQTGMIGINCTNGDGIPLHYTIETVSESTGILTVDVCDEYTYNTVEAPHVAGARVMISHPVTGALITEGITGENGKFSVELPEGYYTLNVTAERHESYTNTILLDPGVEKNLTVIISFLAIRKTWGIVETEIEDEYEIVVNSTYETNVPMPVVILDIPEKIDGDNMAVGETIIVYFTATNKGLITALNTTISIPKDSDEWDFEALADAGPFDLEAQQSVTIPVAITRKLIGDGSKADNLAEYFNSCMAIVSMDFEALCGYELKHNKYAERMAMKMCAIAGSMGYLFQQLSQLLGQLPGLQLPTSPIDLPTSPIGPPTLPEDENIIPGISDDAMEIIAGMEFNLCDTCHARKGERLLNSVIGLSCLAEVNEFMNNAIELAKDIQGVSEEEQRRLTLTWLQERIQEHAIELRRELDQTINDYYNGDNNNNNDDDDDDDDDDLLEVIDALLELAVPCPGDTPNTPGGTSNNSAEEVFNTVVNNTVTFLHHYDEVRRECFGDNVWYNNENVEEKNNFFDFLLENLDATYEEIMEVRPADVTVEQVLRLLERIYNFVNNSRSDNTIDINSLILYLEQAEELNNSAIELGYESLADQFNEAYDDLNERYNELSESVCSSASLQLSHSMTMTRQAFRGTLTVFNGHDSIAMENVRLSLEVRDENGTLATSHEFQINMENMENFEGDAELNAEWSLAATKEGVATILFIPTKYAAPTTAKNYSFGGKLSYLDPFKGIEVTINLYPVTLTVKPSPNLKMNYFVQRDIYGDDPLTTEVVEASVPAEFSLLINNNGYGDANNVRMQTQQPEIVDNEKGLFIDFELLYSQLNGEEKTMALGGSVLTDFGTIPAQGSAYVQWWLQSSLLGHFTEYDISATHVNSYGNEDLSLLDTITIHELIRSIKINVENDSTTTAFLTNDIIDADDLPDILYLTDGTTEDVYITATSTINKNSDTEYVLIAYPSQLGWNYGSLVDPTDGKQEIISIIRLSDGAEIDIRNFWQTDRTLRDGNDHLYENRIHFIDKFGLDEEVYLLTFADKPETILEVECFIGLPENNEVIMDPLEEVVVRFNKDIDASTFTENDIALNIEGVSQDVSQIVIIPLSDKEFKLDISELSAHNGYYVLTVQTAEIMDQEGFNGKKGKMAQWRQYVFGNQTIVLEDGWNWTSFYLDMNDEEDFNMFKNALGENAEQIKSQFQYTNYQNSSGVWIGDLNIASTEKMYMVKMSEKQAVNIEGYFANPSEHPITLEPNWTWFSFMLNNNISIEDGLTNFTPNHGDYIKSQAGFSQYVDGLGWFGDCEIFEVGQGYMYKNTTNTTKTLVYPSAFNIERTVNNITPTNKYWSVNPNKYSTNMSMIAVVNFNGEQMSDYEIAAFCNDECRGTARPVFIEHLNAYMIFLTVYGNHNDEITFKYYDVYSEQEYNHNDDNVLYVENGTLGNISDPYILNFSGENVDENQYYKLEVYPNPVDRNVEVILGNNYKIVEVYNSLGVKIAEYQNVNSIKGIETSGVYIIKTANNNSVKYCRLFVK